MSSRSRSKSREREHHRRRKDKKHRSKRDKSPQFLPLIKDLQSSIKVLTNAVMQDRQPRSRSRSVWRRHSNPRSTDDDLVVGQTHRHSQNLGSQSRGSSPENSRHSAEVEARSKSLRYNDNENSLQDDVLVTTVLDQETAALLGDQHSVDTPKGPKLHPELVSRWDVIAMKGLPKEERDAIKQRAPLPANSNYFGPATNPELKKVVSTYTRDKDDELRRVQDNVSVCITGLGNIINSLLEDKEINKKELIKNLSDTGRYLVGTQYSLSLIRRKNIRANVKEANMKDLLSELPIYPLLFGDDLSSKIKAANAMNKVGNEMNKSSSYATAEKAKPHYRQKMQTYRHNNPKDSSRTEKELPRLENSKESLNSKRPQGSRRNQRSKGGQVTYRRRN